MTDDHPARHLIGLRQAVDHALPDADRDTLSHLLRTGMGANSLRALRSDLGYLEAWSRATRGRALDWPPSRETVLTFIAHHLWDPDEKVRDPGHGMPRAVSEALREAGALKAPGPHAPATVSRRMASWRALCRWRGVEGPFPDPEVTATLRAAVKASARERGRHSKRVVDKDLAAALLDHLKIEAASNVAQDRETAGMRMRALRDRALIATMFASGGRRRSEVASLVRGQVLRLEDIDAGDGTTLTSVGLRLGRTKTTSAGDAARVFLSGRAAVALLAWIEAAGIEAGHVFRRIDRWGTMSEHGIAPAAVNAVLKARLAELGHDPRDFSAHGVRAGYITSALKAGIPAPEVMEQTLHRSMDTLLGYFKDEKQREGRAARLL
ncbi:tyrosine-type recombinase/integrase [Jannaschia formosa]|uniref:tyrosine-type recombinase/integrase n=1 Tax=Jannaschia formosa TaxID=2259592 RepID=UPI000E1B926B|nr:tyrosine-type recombinase/integrase [Jannaschia formosa]TFL16031.1 integrase [Jannaschia formosa]